MPPGRALVGPDGIEAQLAVLDVDTSGAGQVTALERIAAQVRARAPVTARSRPGCCRCGWSRCRAGGGRRHRGGGEGGRPPGRDGRWSVSAVTTSSRSASTCRLDGPAFVVAGRPAAGARRRWPRSAGGCSVRAAGSSSSATAAHRCSRSRASRACSPARSRGRGRPRAAAADPPRPRRPGRRRRDPARHPGGATPARAAPARRHRRTALLLLAGSTADMGGSFRGLTVEARRGRTGLLLGALSLGRR